MPEGFSPFVGKFPAVENSAAEMPQQENIQGLREEQRSLEQGSPTKLKKVSKQQIHPFKLNPA